MKNIQILIITPLCFLTACGPGEVLGFVKDATVEKFQSMKTNVDYACDQDTLDDFTSYPSKYSTEEGMSLISKMRTP